jgi:hypothetical protein
LQLSAQIEQTNAKRGAGGYHPHMPPTRRLSAALIALAGIAVLDVRPANALSCASAPYGEKLFLEIETITEDGNEITDPSYVPYSVFLHATTQSEKTRLWVITASEAWWQDFE